MKKIMEWLEVSLEPKVSAAANQRHMLSVRQGLILALPLTIVGSFFVLLLYLPIPGYEEFIAPYQQIIDVPYRFTVGIMSLLSVIGISYSLTKNYFDTRLNPMTAALLALSTYFVASVDPVITDEFGRVIQTAQLGSSDLFAAILVAITTVEIYRFFTIKGMTIKMPAGVPQGIYDSFAAIIPGLASILLFWVIRCILGIDIASVLSVFLQPLAGFLGGNSLLGGLLVVFLITFFWTLGIHGPYILGPVIRPIWDAGIAANMDAYANGVPADQLPNIFTEQFLQWFIWIGGAGATLPLVCLFMFSKSKTLQKLGKISFVPGLFNINEPVIFGTPIVMNPILGIPFIVAPLVMTVVSYTFLKLGLVPMMMARLPFTFPAPIAAYLSTDFTVMAAVLVIINFVIALVIYLPFFKMYEKQLVKIEKEGAEKCEE